MVWFPIVLLIMAILVVNDKFTGIKKLIDENDDRYASRFTDLEVHLKQMEGQPKTL
jgi:hypothetical protein